uniref:Uncharacterized protein n=1 Tax=Utricularia reniformis TaxID=192314 RepID=A0A1Y0B288_9LAMI|nr:hypothetical protein AEK19_MT1309 [Utricularia reniformis]ART31510.1 hypothetical protein AEK19_MT1309 [Utricularia reniformis]
MSDHIADVNRSFPFVWEPYFYSPRVAVLNWSSNANLRSSAGTRFVNQPFNGRLCPMIYVKH